jgi:phage gpG-like protein
VKKITFTLDEKSINAAIKQLSLYKKELSRKANLLVQRLVAEGVEIAKQEVKVLGAFDSGELHDSLDGLMYTDGTRGIIFTNCGHAAFVEFGTGVVGAGSPHPTMPWQYDVNAHGEAGWVYYDEKQGRFRWTKGMPSRPYMYLTARQLEERAMAIAREVFGNG